MGRFILKVSYGATQVYAAADWLTQAESELHTVSHCDSLVT